MSDTIENTPLLEVKNLNIWQQQHRNETRTYSDLGKYVTNLWSL